MAGRFGRPWHTALCLRALRQCRCILARQPCRSSSASARTACFWAPTARERSRKECPWASAGATGCEILGYHEHFYIRFPIWCLQVWEGPCLYQTEAVNGVLFKILGFGVYFQDSTVLWFAPECAGESSSKATARSQFRFCSHAWPRVKTVAMWFSSRTKPLFCMLRLLLDPQPPSNIPLSTIKDHKGSVKGHFGGPGIYTLDSKPQNP